jgi:hypothetical protein
MGVALEAIAEIFRYPMGVALEAIAEIFGYRLKNMDKLVLYTSSCVICRLLSLL